MRKFLIIFLLYILVYGLLTAKDLSESSQENEFSRLELRGYELDIETATKSGLLAWTQRLGLPHTGSSENMQKMLYTYYGIEEPENKTGINQTDSVTIISTDNLVLLNTYGSIVILSGDVIIEIVEIESENLYTIKAQQIVLNNSTNIISASGSVDFTRSNSETREKIDSFNCSKFSLSFTSWDGIISNMETSSSRENISGEDIIFSLTGDSVYKSSKGALVLNNGIISSAYEDPHFSIHAGTITFLNEGDWFADQAFLYLGRVPVFYLPVFFYPGVDFYFNPSFGFSADRGAFLNTTTMIFGSLNESAASKATSFTTFLQAEEQTKSIINGIQGTLLEMYSPESEILVWANETESYLAVSFDVYEQVGVALGIDAKLNNFYIFQNFNVKTIFAINPESIKPIFRFLVEPEIKVDTSGYSISIALPFYSDEQVSRDYMQRKTQFELGDLTGNAQFPTSSNFDSFIWTLKGSIIPDIASFKPIVEQLVLSNVSSNVEWDIIQPYMYEISSIGLLTHSIKISGKLLTGNLTNDSALNNSDNELTSSSSTGSYEPSLSDLAGHPFVLKQNIVIKPQKADSLKELPLITTPLILTDKIIPLLKDNEKNIDEIFTYQISYSMKNTGNIDIIFDDGEPQYQKIINRLDSNFLFTGNIFENIISVRNIIKPSSYIQQHNKISDSIINWSSYIDQDRARTKFLLNNDLTVGIPLLGISYILKTRLLSYNFIDADYNLSTFEWNVDNVLQHTISASLPISIISSNFTVSVTLPPDNPQFKPKIDTKIGNLTTSFYTSLSEDSDGVWQYDPLTFRLSYSSPNSPLSGSLIAGYDYSALSLPQNIFIPLTLQPNLTLRLSDTIRISQKLFFNFGGNALEQGISRIDMGKTYAELLFLFDDTAAGGSGEIVPAKININSDQTITEFSFWKNRIVLSTDFILNWNYNFQNPSDNLLSVSFKFQIRIEEFIDISIVSKSKNNATHRYLEGSLNILEDLLKSFNYFNINDRYDSNFNLSEIEMHITHFMKDWDLNFDYTGKIALNTDNEYVWSPLASIYISWKAVPEIDISASIEHDTITGIQ
jgi:hypothetical protein